jgi:hypothetical protein
MLHGTRRTCFGVPVAASGRSDMAYAVSYVPAIIVPDVPRAGQLELLRQWQIERQARAEAEAQWRPYNVCFEHDPNWNRRFMSIQCAHDGNHPVWRGARVLMQLAGVMPYGMGIGLV